MAVVKQSFLSNLIGKNTYEELNGYARIIILVGTCLLLLFGGLSVFFHADIINWILKLITGTSLLFIAYIGALILVLDIQVNVDEPERISWEAPLDVPKPMKYKLTIFWGLLLVISGIIAIYFTNKYRKQYAFECESFLVDTSNGIYHLDYTDCEIAEESNNLEEKKGYEIGDTYHFCEWCKEWLEDIEDNYEPS